MPARPRPVSEDRSEIHLEHFASTVPIPREDRLCIRRLVFLEICEFICDNFDQVQAISFSFTRGFSSYGEAVPQSSARAEIIERIGAVDIQITPKPNALPGNFVVSGVWTYSESNRIALRRVLDEQRQRYREHPLVAGPVEKAGVRAALRRLLVATREDL